MNIVNHLPEIKDGANISVFAVSKDDQGKNENKLAVKENVKGIQATDKSVLSNGQQSAVEDGVESIIHPVSVDLAHNEYVNESLNLPTISEDHVLEFNTISNVRTGGLNVQHKKSFIESKLSIHSENMYAIHSSTSTNNETTTSNRTFECRSKMYTLVTDPRFEAVAVIFILFNTLCLAMEYHGMSKEYSNALEEANHLFSIVFLLENILKVIALGLHGYLKSRWNIFDGVIVTISIVR